jgi:translation initiation factor IF-3
MDRLAEAVSGVAVVEQTPKIEGRSMTMVLAPSRNQRVAAESEDQQQQG